MGINKQHHYDKEEDLNVWLETCLSRGIGFGKGWGDGTGEGYTGNSLSVGYGDGCGYGKGYIYSLCGTGKGGS